MQRTIKHNLYQFMISLLFLSLALSYVSIYSTLAKHHFQITQASEDGSTASVTDFFDDEKIITHSPIRSIISFRVIISRYNCLSSFDQYTFFHWQPPQLAI